MFPHLVTHLDPMEAAWLVPHALQQAHSKPDGPAPCALGTAIYWLWLGPGLQSERKAEASLVLMPWYWCPLTRQGRQCKPKPVTADPAEHSSEPEEPLGCRGTLHRASSAHGRWVPYVEVLGELGRAHHPPSLSLCPAPSLSAFFR